MQINDDLFDQIDSYQSKEVSKYSVDNVLLKTKEIRTSEVEQQQNLEDADEFASPISIINLTGISLTIHRIQDEENKKAFVGGNIREPEKVYLPIRVEFEDNFNPIEHIDLSKLHSGRHQLNDDIENEVYFGVHLNRMHKILTVRSFYTIYNQTIFNYVLRIYGEKIEEYDIPPGQKVPVLNSMKGKK